MTAPLFAIDAPVYFFRSYFALGSVRSSARDSRWQSEEGMPTEAIFGFSVFLIRLLQAEQPVYIAAAFDESLGTGFRHQLYSDYKANRVLPDENITYQFDGCKAVARALGVSCFGCSSYEADDYLAAFTAAARADQQVYVISRDKDLTQLLGPKVSLWDYGYGDPLTCEDFLSEKGFDPALVPDWLALTGDPGDNIPGVPGIGPKTASAILSALGAIENWIDTPELLSSLEVRGAGKLASKVVCHRDQLLLAKRLATLAKSIPAAPKLPDLARRPVDVDGARELFIRYGLQGLTRRLEGLCQ